MGLLKDYFTNPNNLGGLLTTGIASGINSLGNLVNYAVDNKRMEQQQQYRLDLMEQQNEYQIAQWNRENAYNDPSKVAQRFRNAGINPRAIFDRGSGGAGIAGSLSPAPNASAPLPSPSSYFSGLGSSLANDISIQSRSNLESAETNLRNQEALNVAERTRSSIINNKSLHTQNLARIDEMRANKLKLLADSKLSEEQRKKVKKEVEELDAEIIQIKKDIQKADHEIALLDEQVKESKARQSESNARIDKMTYEKRLLDVETELARNKVETEKLNQALIKAQTGHYDALKQQIFKDIEYIGVKMDLTRQEIKAIKHQIAQDWTKIAINLAKATSHEVRRWLFGWIPGTSETYTHYEGTKNDHTITTKTTYSR